MKFSEKVTKEFLKGFLNGIFREILIKNRKEMHGGTPVQFLEEFLRELPINL